MLMMLAYCEGKVLNTPHLADATSLDSRGFFASVVRLWPGSGQRKKSFRAETASRPSAVFKCLASPLNRGEIERYTLGGYMPKNQSAHLRVVEQTPINEATARWMALPICFSVMTIQRCSRQQSLRIYLNRSAWRSRRHWMNCDM
jgi:hypothetical protein